MSSLTHPKFVWCFIGWCHQNIRCWRSFLPKPLRVLTKIIRFIRRLQLLIVGSSGTLGMCLSSRLIASMYVKGPPSDHLMHFKIFAIFSVVPISPMVAKMCHWNILWYCFFYVEYHNFHTEDTVIWRSKIILPIFSIIWMLYYHRIIIATEQAILVGSTTASPPILWNSGGPSESTGFKSVVVPIKKSKKSRPIHHAPASPSAAGGDESRQCGEARHGWRGCYWDHPRRSGERGCT